MKIMSGEVNQEVIDAAWSIEAKETFHRYRPTKQGKRKRGYKCPVSTCCGVNVDTRVGTYRVIEITRDDWAEIRLAWSMFPSFIDLGFNPDQLAASLGEYSGLPLQLVNQICSHELRLLDSLHWPHNYNLHRTGYWNISSLAPGHGYAETIAVCLPKWTGRRYVNQLGHLQRELPVLPDQMIAAYCVGAFEYDYHHLQPTQLLRIAYERANPYYWHPSYCAANVTIIAGPLRTSSTRLKPNRSVYHDTPITDHQPEQRHFSSCLGKWPYNCDPYYPDPINLLRDKSLWQPHLRSKARIAATKWRPTWLPSS